MAQARFSVLAAVAEGFDFWGRNRFAAIGPLAIAALGLGLLSSTLPLAGLVVGAIVFSLANLIAQGSLYRLALDGAGPVPEPPNGPLGLQFRRLEIRLLATNISIAAVLVAGGLLSAKALDLMLVWLIGDAGAQAVQVNPETLSTVLTTPQQLAFNLLALALAVGLLVVSVRLSLASPVSVAERRLGLRESLRMTRGETVRMIGLTVLVNLPVMVLQWGAAVFAQLSGQPGSFGWMQMVIGMVSLFFAIPISVGALSHVYLRLRGAR